METLEEAAKAIGTTKSRIWELEHGDTMPRLPMLQKILKHYGLRFDEIADV
jgi:transcriptional regulator with XRE-family HTH domain